MKRRMIVAGMCVGAWLCASVMGQETIVTNLLVAGTLGQGTNAIAAGTQSSAFGEGAVADGDYSHAEGDTTTASGTASHAEGALTIAGGNQSHAEGEATEALADNSHAGGAYARVRAQDSNSFIHATGTATNDMKETQFPDAAHFDHLVTLAPALDADNAVLSRNENDRRYLQPGTAITVSAVRVAGNVSEASGAAVAGGFGNLAGVNSFVGSGTDNSASNSYAAVGAGSGNAASGVASFVGAGSHNSASGTSTFVGAGWNNVAAGSYGAFVGAGADNSVLADYSAIVGGRCNFVSNMTSYSFVGGGYSNYLAGRGYSVIGGGSGNVIVATNGGPTAGRGAYIGGGYNNKITGAYAAIPGGAANTVGGQYGTVAGGRSNVVAGAYGVAGGYGAQALHDGSWVWADSRGGVFPSVTNDEFAIRAAGGLRLEGCSAVGFDPEASTNHPYALWVRNFAATSNDARGLLVTTPEYNGAEGIIFHAASMAGESMASRFIVEANGNVGVGVNNPEHKLQVAGDARISGNMLIPNDGSILSPNFDSGTWGSAYDKWGPNAYLKYGFVRELLVAQNADFQGKVKIGTSSDYAQLNVGAPTGLVTATYAARFESAESADSDKARGVLINFPNTTNPSSILFHAMSGSGPYTNSRVVIKADGRVGIGTSSPEATLHVNGDLRVEGTFTGDGSGLTNLNLQEESDPLWTAASNLYATTSGVATALSGYMPLIGGGSVNGILATYYPPAGSYGVMLRENELHLYGSGGYFGFDYSAGTDGFSVFRRDDPSFPDMYKWTLWDNPWQDDYKPRWKGTIDSDKAIIDNLVVGRSTILGGTITAEELTLAQTGSTSVTFAYDPNYPDYPTMRSGYSDIYFGIPGDPSLWFNYSTGSNIVFGDVGNLQNVTLFGDLQVSGTLHGDGSGLTNLSVTGLNTNTADARYINAAGDTMTGILDLDRHIMTNVVGIYGQNSNDVSDLIIMAGSKTNAGSVGGGALILSGGWTGYGDTYAPVNIRSRLQTPQLVVGQVFGTSSGSSGNNLTVEAGAGYSSTNFGGILCLAGGRGNYGATPGWIRLDSRVDANGQTISNAVFVGNGAGLTNLPVTGLTTNEADARYVIASGDTLTGPIEVDAPINQTNLTVAGWAKIDYVVPQGGLSMGTFTNGLPTN